MPPKLLTTTEAAEFLGVDTRTLEGRRLRGGGPPFIRLFKGPRGPVRYRLADLESWLESRLRASTSDPGPAAA